MHIPPSTILAGFGSLTRRELSDLLALFEDTSLFNVVTSRMSDLVGGSSEHEGSETEAAFQRLLKETSDHIFDSDRPDAMLRLQLWCNARHALDLNAAIPFATRTANVRAADVAQRAANQLRDSISPSDAEESWTDLPDRIWSQLTEESWTDLPDRIWSRLEDFLSQPGPADFSKVVGAQGSRMLAEAAQEGLLDDDTREALVQKVREQLEDAPPELRDQSVEQALKSGDATALTVLTTGSSLVGLGVAVELAGFGAYILAAKASAILPLIGGKAAVSGLALLANPFFIVPTIIGGGVLASRQFGRSARANLASGLTIQMALMGLSAGSKGLATCLNDFKSLTGKSVQAAGADTAQLYNRKVELIGDLVGNPLPETPGYPPKGFEKPPTGATLDGLEQVLFPDHQLGASEAIAVGGMTAGDIVYHAAAIDPAVLAAADFSRSEDLSGIFDFGVFADRVEGMSGKQLEGLESNLRGYVAEQLVATRLQEQGHQVELPDASNTPGYDLIVDGQRFQVKCLQDITGLRKHFETYPEYPVYANAEMVEKIKAAEPAPEWAGKVFGVEGYDRDITETIMQHSLKHGASLDDLDIPVFAIAVSAAKNVHAWWKGTLALEDLPFEVAVDAAVKGSLTTAGGFAGQSIGLLLFGPAGAVVLGAVGGTGALFGSGWARERLDEVLLDPEWMPRLDEATEDFRVALKAVMRTKLNILKSKMDQLDSLEGELAPWIRARLMDNALAIAEGVAELDFDIVEHSQPKRATELLRLMKDVAVHPWTVQKQLTCLADCLAAKPTVGGVARGWFHEAQSALSDWIRPKKV